jgi:D-glycero-D-manno-heptose 1,7-bisphosphate phosphatase
MEPAMQRNGNPQTPMNLIILDRDGVINEDSDAYIKSPDEWAPIPGSLEAIARLHQAGYRVVIATNQSGIGRGLFDLEILNLIHRKMHRMVQESGGSIDAVFFCPDVDEANLYRKPNPGMLLEIGRRLKRDLKGVPVVGDSVRDIRAARAASAWPLLVRTGKGAATLARESESCANVLVFDDLAAVADYLLDASRKTNKAFPCPPFKPPLNPST